MNVCHVCVWGGASQMTGERFKSLETWVIASYELLIMHSGSQIQVLQRSGKLTLESVWEFLKIFVWCVYGVDLCVYIYVCVYTNVYMCMCVGVIGWPQVSSLVFLLHVLYWVRVSHWIGETGAVSPTCSSDLICFWVSYDLLVGDLNSTLHACMVNVLSTESFSQPQELITY